MVFHQLGKSSESIGSTSECTSYLYWVFERLLLNEGTTYGFKRARKRTKNEIAHILSSGMCQTVGGNLRVT